jgi:hypothetical protein
MLTLYGVAVTAENARHIVASSRADVNRSATSACRYASRSRSSASKEEI